jgi:hypothetical protein
MINLISVKLVMFYLLFLWIKSLDNLLIFPTFMRIKEGRWSLEGSLQDKLAWYTMSRLAAQKSTKDSDPVVAVSFITVTDVYARICSCRQCWASKYRGL